MARPRSTFLTKEQLTKMDRMAKDQCKHRTIAEALGVGREALRKYYLPRLIKKAAEGRVELHADQRRMQKDHPNVAIFRGKNYLGQTDKQEIQNTVKHDLSPELKALGKIMAEKYAEKTK